jgi:hypothetical protein
MNRAAFGNFEQSALFRFGQVAAQFDFPINVVQETLLRFAIPTILRVNAEMLQPNRDALKINAFTFRVQTQCHRCTGAKTGK